jgi:hypothetical protein
MRITGSSSNRLVGRKSGDGRAYYREGRQRARPNPTRDADRKGVQTLLRVKQLMDEAGRQMNAIGTGARSAPPQRKKARVAVITIKSTAPSGPVGSSIPEGAPMLSSPGLRTRINIQGTEKKT